jgi:hypothetical protein
MRWTIELDYLTENTPGGQNSRPSELGTGLVRHGHPPSVVTFALRALKIRFRHLQN